MSSTLSTSAPESETQALILLKTIPTFIPSTGKKVVESQLKETPVLRLALFIQLKKNSIKKMVGELLVPRDMWVHVPSAPSIVFSS